jgi:PAS domain-containing protein
VGNGEAVHEFEGLIFGDLDRVVASVRERAITGGAVSVTADVRALSQDVATALVAHTTPPAEVAARLVSEACTSTRAATCLAAVKAFRDGFLDVLDSSAMSPDEVLPHVRTVGAFFDRLELETLAIAGRLEDGGAGAPVLKDANMLAALPMPAFIIARDGTMLFHNDAALLVADDSNGRRSDGTLQLPGPVRRELAAFRVSGATGHTAESELSTGRGLRYFQMRFSPVDVAGERESALVILSDLTHRRRAEEALRRSQAKYQSVFEHMATGFALVRVVLDRRNRPMDYVIIEVNRALESMFSLRAEQLIGCSASEAIALVGGIDIDWRATLAPVALTGQSSEVEVYVASVGKWISVSAFSPIRGHIALMLSDTGVVRDGPPAKGDAAG